MMKTKFYLVETNLYRPATKGSFFERTVYEAVNGEEAVTKDNKSFLGHMNDLNKRDIEIANKVLMVSDNREDVARFEYSGEVIWN